MDASAGLRRLPCGELGALRSSRSMAARPRLPTARDRSKVFHVLLVKSSELLKLALKVEKHPTVRPPAEWSCGGVEHRRCDVYERRASTALLIYTLCLGRSGGAGPDFSFESTLTQSSTAQSAIQRPVTAPFAAGRDRPDERAVRWSLWLSSIGRVWCPNAVQCKPQRPTKGGRAGRCTRRRTTGSSPVDGTERSLNRTGCPGALPCDANRWRRVCLAHIHVGDDAPHSHDDEGHCSCLG
jgi:hypothetical protein